MRRPRSVVGKRGVYAAFAEKQRGRGSVFLNLYQIDSLFEIEFNPGLGEGESEVPIDAAGGSVVVRRHQRGMADPVPPECREQRLADATRQPTAALVRPGQEIA